MHRLLGLMAHQRPGSYRAKLVACQGRYEESQRKLPERTVKTKEIKGQRKWRMKKFRYHASLAPHIETRLVRMAPAKSSSRVHRNVRTPSPIPHQGIKVIHCSL